MVVLSLLGMAVVLSAQNKGEPLPTFKGTFHSAGGGKLYLNTGDENQMEFWITRKTVILQGSKKIKLDDLKQGTPISVEAKLIVATHMDAVTIRVEPPKN
ncbi:MAG: hypothetical protein HY820_01360 [Acidobacteria bacterium]|nr:hypothetical protein [Acidobacteriota bacterium]